MEYFSFFLLLTWKLWTIFASHLHFAFWFLYDWGCLRTCCSFTVNLVAVARCLPVRLFLCLWFFSNANFVFREEAREAVRAPSYKRVQIRTLSCPKTGKTWVQSSIKSSLCSEVEWWLKCALPTSSSISVAISLQLSVSPWAAHLA